MNLSKEDWERMAESVQRQAAGINAVSDRLEYNIETAIKNGGAENVITQLTELESTIRVLKRSLNVAINPQLEAFRPIEFGSCQLDTHPEYPIR